MSPTLVYPRRALFALFALGSFSLLSQAQNQPSTNPQQLVREVVANELKAAKEDQSHWMYQSRDDASDKRETREVVESKDGVIYRVIGAWGKPLSNEQQKDEDRRIQSLLSSPYQQRKQQVARDQDARKAKEMLEMLPNAFLYTFDSQDEDTVHLSFKPNPSFDPPTRETKVFHSMEGIMLVDRRQKRLKQLSGKLASDVEFGGGFLGRLKKGGTFEVQQSDVGGGHWQPILTDVHINGRALFFKTIKEQQHEVCSNYRRVPDNLSLAQAAEMLTKNASALSSVMKPAR
jgi:hypothetical protein